MKITAFLVSVLLVLGTNSASAEDIYTDPTDQEWGVISTNDGFSKSFTIFKNASNQGYSDLGTETTYSIEIQCEARKLEVLVYADPIGIYPSSDLSRVGYALVKVDSGKITKYKYMTLKDSSGIGIWSPKLLTAAMLKGKRQVAFKISSSIQADTVANFNLGDLNTYVSKFKALGCALK